MALERFFNQQNIERYRKLLDIVSDQTQRRQIMNFLEDEEERARYLKPSECSPALSEAA